MKAELWLADLDAVTDALEACERATPRLSPDQIERIAGLASPAAQRAKRATYVAQQLVLERLLGPCVRGVTLPRDRYGRSVLPPALGTGAVSLAHSGHLVLIGCITCPPGSLVRIGVDIEQPRAVTMSARRRSIMEQAACSLSSVPLPGRDEQRRFLAAWVRLEALAKADGRGIGHLLSLIGAMGSAVPHAHGARELAGELGCEVSDLDLGPDLHAAVAISGGSKELPIRIFPAAVSSILAA